MSNEQHTSIAAILKTMKDSGLHIVRNRPSTGEGQLFTLHNDSDGTRVELGPFALSVLQEMVNQGLVTQDKKQLDEGRPIYRLTEKGRSAAT
jgi:hypothetical protein